MCILSRPTWFSLDVTNGVWSKYDDLFVLYKRKHIADAISPCFQEVGW